MSTFKNESTVIRSLTFSQQLGRERVREILWVFTIRYSKYHNNKKKNYEIK